MKSSIIIASVLLGTVIAVLFAFKLVQRQKPEHVATVAGVAATSSTPVIMPADVSQQKVSATIAATQSTDPYKGMKLYRNEEFGFEFWYPEGWEIKKNTFGSVNSKLSLDFVRIDGKATIPFDGINVVTPEFYEHYIENMSPPRVEVSDVSVANFFGKKMRYNEESVDVTSVALLIGKYGILFESERKHEKELDQILSTFKFLKASH